MTKKVKIIIAIVVVLIIAAVCCYFFYWKPKQEEEAKLKAVGTDPTKAPASNVSTPSKTTVKPLAGKKVNMTLSDELV